MPRLFDILKGKGYNPYRGAGGRFTSGSGGGSSVSTSNKKTGSKKRGFKDGDRVVDETGRTGTISGRPRRGMVYWRRDDQKSYEVDQVDMRTLTHVAPTRKERTDKMVRDLELNDAEVRRVQDYRRRVHNGNFWER